MRSCLLYLAPDCQTKVELTFNELTLNANKLTLDTECNTLLMIPLWYRAAHSRGTDLISSFPQTYTSDVLTALDKHAVDANLLPSMRMVSVHGQCRAGLGAVFFGRGGAIAHGLGGKSIIDI